MEKSSVIPAEHNNSLPLADYPHFLEFVESNFGDSLRSLNEEQIKELVELQEKLQDTQEKISRLIEYAKVASESQLTNVDKNEEYLSVELFAISEKIELKVVLVEFFLRNPDLLRIITSWVVMQIPIESLNLPTSVEAIDCPEGFSNEQKKDVSKIIERFFDRYELIIAIMGILYDNPENRWKENEEIYGLEEMRNDKNLKKILNILNLLITVPGDKIIFLMYKLLQNYEKFDDCIDLNEQGDLKKIIEKKKGLNRLGYFKAICSGQPILGEEDLENDDYQEIKVTKELVDLLMPMLTNLKLSQIKILLKELKTNNRDTRVKYGFGKVLRIIRDYDELYSRNAYLLKLLQQMGMFPGFLLPTNPGK